jgi:carbonic anhydrase
MGLARSALSATADIQPIEARLKACEEETVRVSLRNLMTFPWIADAVGQGRLQMHGAYFDIRLGALALLGPDNLFRHLSIDVAPKD